jgi:tetratricopeptide (TPR) repeat protein
MSTTLDEHARAGIAAINEHRYDDAIASFQKALAIDDSRPDLNNALGMAYLHRGEAGSAVPYLERAVQLAEPFDAEEHQDMKRHFHLMLATTYELLDRTADARRMLEQSVQRWPDVIEPRLQLAQLLLGSCALDEGVAAYAALAKHPGLDEDRQEAAQAVVDAIGAWRESDVDAGTFLRAHAEGYQNYFAEILNQSGMEGWYAEAARMARGADGEVKPIIPQGARPYAMQRVDLVNPQDGQVATIHNEQEPLVIALNGLEPLAQLPILLPWAGKAFPVWVCTRCPWHWLPITVQFEQAAPDEERIAALDPVIGDWYLAGFNGDYGDKDKGRFHFVTDPEPMGDRAVAYTIDLGRSKYEAIDGLIKRLEVLHERRPIRRLLLGQGHLPD